MEGEVTGLWLATTFSGIAFPAAIGFRCARLKPLRAVLDVGAFGWRLIGESTTGSGMICATYGFDGEAWSDVDIFGLDFTVELERDEPGDGLVFEAEGARGLKPPGS